MSATTRWRDNQADNIEEVCEKMLSRIIDDERTNSIYWRNISCREVFDEIQTININGEEIRFNALHYRYDQITAQDDSKDDRSIIKNGLIIIYQQNSSVFYIVDQNSSAKKLLRKLLAYTGKNEVDKNCFDFPDDFFIWLVNQVYNSNAIIENTATDETKILSLEEIKGIRGDTEDLLTRVSATGESVMNVISTLAFLLESKKVNQVILTMRYTGHTCICIKIQKNTLEIENPYHGAFDGDTTEQLLAKLYLLLYLEILPLIEQEYRTAKEEEWTHEAYINFLTGLKDDILEKINNKILDLRA